MAGLVALLTLYATTIGLLGLVVWVLLVIARWKMFQKAGEAGWKSIIPVYSTYISFKICWGTAPFWALVAMAAFAGAFAGTSAPADYPMLGVLVALLYCAIAVVGLVMLYKTSLAFGHGIGMALALLFFPNVATLVLGFGSSRYVGPQA